MTTKGCFPRTESTTEVERVGSFELTYQVQLQEVEKKTSVRYVGKRNDSLSETSPRYVNNTYIPP